jgi:hypothetical protein
MDEQIELNINKVLSNLGNHSLLPSLHGQFFLGTDISYARSLHILLFFFTNLWVSGVAKVETGPLKCQADVICK